MRRIQCVTAGQWILSPSRSINPGWWLLILSAVFAACTPTNTPNDRNISAWGNTLTITQAEQSNAPALWVANDRITAAWVGADESGVHQDARFFTSDDLTETVVLPLPPVHPYAQTIFPAQLDYTHFLWLDAGDNGENRLYSALITPDVTVERGPTPVSNAQTFRYTALASGDGGLQTVWSGGLLSEPTLYYQPVDAVGRPGAATALTLNADWPTLIRANDGTRHLFWLRPVDQRLFYGMLTESGLTGITEIDTALNLSPNSRLVNLQSALDVTHMYVFWNIVDASGEAESWFISREINGGEWSAPIKLRIALTDSQAETPLASLDTGFNSGTTFVTDAGDALLSWTMPLSGQYAILPVAAQVGDKIALVYFQGGAIRGYQPITAADLIGLPTLQVDRDRYLYLAWAQPGAGVQAELRLTSLRLNQWSALLPADN